MQERCTGERFLWQTNHLTSVWTKRDQISVNVLFSVNPLVKVIPGVMVVMIHRSFSTLLRGYICLFVTCLSSCINACTVLRGKTACCIMPAS